MCSVPGFSASSGMLPPQQPMVMPVPNQGMLSQGTMMASVMQQAPPGVMATQQGSNMSIITSTSAFQQQQQANQQFSSFSNLSK